MNKCCGRGSTHNHMGMQHIHMHLAVRMHMHMHMHLGVRMHMHMHMHLGARWKGRGWTMRG